MQVTEKIRKNLAIQLSSLQARMLSGFPQTEIEAIAANIVERNSTNPAQPLVVLARMLVERATSPNRFADNGEQALLDRVRPLDFKVLFDAGANVGVWSQYAHQVFPAAALHAFEIVPSTFAALRRALDEDEHVHLNQFGLSDENGAVMVNTYSSDLISSIYALDNDPGVTGRIECEVRRGADYATARGIERIDFLKVDVEGAEGKVFDGFEPMLSEGRIRLIQYEYNRGAILGDFLLKHAYEFFQARGYRLGKLLPNGAYFHDYHFSHEDFIGPNYVAVRADDDALIRQIAVTHS